MKQLLLLSILLGSLFSFEQKVKEYKVAKSYHYVRTVYEGHGTMTAVKEEKGDK